MRKCLAALMAALMLITAGCSPAEPVQAPPAAQELQPDALFKGLDLPPGYDLRQFEGMTLNFIVENNLYAAILSHESEAFSQATGINVRVRAMDFDTLAKKVNLDFISKAGKYQIVYVDPYQTLNRFSGDLESLVPYATDPTGPHIKGFMADFFDFQTEACAYFGDRSQVYTIPFDSTTMILYYRKDIFDKYREPFYRDMHYDWTPGTPDFTWERYCEVAAWIDANVPDSEVRYGAGHMAQQHNSIFCDFSSVLAAYGGDYFGDADASTLGARRFDRILTTGPAMVKALDMYKRILSVSAPDSVNWNWTDSANAFRSGQIAMMPNWDENYTYMEHDTASRVSGKVGYAVLPRGDVRSANIYGGSGIGINKYATPEEKKAAWLYIVWATSAEMQLKVLMHPEGGCLPTRTSAYRGLTSGIPGQLPEGEVPAHVPAVLSAWSPENLYLRPKVSSFYEAEQVLIRNLHAMVQEKLDSREVSRRITEELENVRQKQ